MEDSKNLNDHAMGTSKTPDESAVDDHSEATTEDLEGGIIDICLSRVYNNIHIF